MLEVVPYEKRLDADFDWALREGSMHFEQGGSVQQSLRRITERLDRLGVPYAVAGGMALFYHGVRRFTEDVIILVTRDGLKHLQEKLTGLGYVPPFTGSKNLRDTENGVKIEFLIAGDYPGDGKPKPVAFPDPANVAVEKSGIRFLSLSTLVELKLASGVSNLQRGKDLIDVQTLIETLGLDETLADALNLYVRDKYLELVRIVRNNPVTPE